MNAIKKLIIQLIQDAYLDDDGNYAAHAKVVGLEPKDGDCPDEVRVYWDTLEDFDGDDEGDACDWSKPTGARLNGGSWIADKFDGLNEYDGYAVEYLNTDGSRL